MTHLCEIIMQQAINRDLMIITIKIVIYDINISLSIRKCLTPEPAEIVSEIRLGFLLAKFLC